MSLPHASGELLNTATVLEPRNGGISPPSLPNSFTRTSSPNSSTETGKNGFVDRAAESQSTSPTIPDTLASVGPADPTREVTRRSGRRRVNWFL